VQAEKPVKRVGITTNIKKMNQICILIVADVEAALASGNLQGNVYLVDNNGPQGSTLEGNAELNTACHDTQVISWSVTPIDANTNVSIVGFTGQAIPATINPIAFPNGVWSGTVETQGATGKYQYSCILSMDGKQMTFDPFLIVS
jgi:hypothetical protein